ncbi:hypothetical protein JHV675_54220 [Mycobacterium avium subsp. hominissuis]
MVAGWASTRAIGLANRRSRRSRPDGPSASRSIVIGVYAYLLFWVRALQVLLLLYVVPFFLAQATPITMLREEERHDVEQQQHLQRAHPEQQVGIHADGAAGVAAALRRAVLPRAAS